jgi:hypothetical protein
MSTPSSGPSLSPGTQAMIKLAEEHMRMLHKEYQQS